MTSLRKPLSQALTRSQGACYICTGCKSRIRSFYSPSQQRGYASKQDLPLTERLRRKIWGTDNPPGLADPYGGPSFLEKRRMRREAAQRHAAGIPEEYAQVNDFARAEATEITQPRENKSQDYVEARSWDGLQHIGHLGDWRDLPPEAKDQFESWLSSTSQVANDRRELLSCLHQAVVECLTCKEAQIQPEAVSLLDPSEVDSQVYASTMVEPLPSGFKIHFASEDERRTLVTILQAVHEACSSPSLQGNHGDAEALQHDEEVNNEALERHDLEHHDEEIVADEDEHFGSPLVQVGVTHYEVDDEIFLTAKLDLQDPLSFTILKRFSQLSGHRIPDPVLNTTVASNKPLSYLLDALYEAVKPKPKNLAEVLMQKQALMGQGNVWVIPRRATPVDREKEVGRWKVIEKELQDRGLPVLGKLQS